MRPQSFHHLLHPCPRLHSDLLLLRVDMQDLVQQGEAEHGFIAEGYAIGGESGPHAPDFCTCGEEFELSCNGASYLKQLLPWALEWWSWPCKASLAHRSNLKERSQVPASGENVRGAKHPETLLFFSDATYTAHRQVLPASISDMARAKACALRIVNLHLPLLWAFATIDWSSSSDCGSYSCLGKAS